MAERLQEMTLQELWKLFPITLVPHNPLWKFWAEEEIGSLSELLSEYKPMINHIGSTAVAGIIAKPVIDILVEIPPDIRWDYIRKTMEENGYIHMSDSDIHMSFNKGYTPDGYADRVFHIHFHRTGDNDEIVFRDCLISRPGLAKEYENLKSSLLSEFGHDRDGYTEAKTSFIKRTMAEAMARPLRIERIDRGKDRFMPLLMIGDESEEMIARYLGRGNLYVGFVYDMAVAVCVTTSVDENTTEVKNIAVRHGWRHRGIGRKMLQHAESLNQGRTITLGTGETPSTLRFYRSCGYRYSHRIAGFFTENYPDPIIEEGVLLKDMVYLTKQL